MRRQHLLALALLLIGAAFVFRIRSRTIPSAAEHQVITSELPPVCPWREPGRDLARFFPAATGYSTETRIMSAMIAPIRKQLGRMMTIDENPLRIFRVRDARQVLGSVLVCRAKGEHGGIELVVALETNDTIRAVAIQSQREPESVARALTNRLWLASFAGKNHENSFRPGRDLSEVPPDARLSADAIADSVHSQLVILSFAERLAGTTDEGQNHHHHY